MTLAVDVWSDIACPWCYVGKRRLEGALARFAHAGDVTVRWRSFELDPSTPAEVDRSVPYAERLARKYRTSIPQAEGMIAHMTQVGAEDGIEMRFDLLRAGSTFDAHRALHFARRRGLASEMKERLLRAYFTEGALVSDHQTLANLADEVGLDADGVAAALATDQHADEVRADEAMAVRLGVHGVPYFAFGGAFGVSGAQPIETMLHALDRASRKASETASPGDGDVCGPGGG